MNPGLTLCVKVGSIGDLLKEIDWRGCHKRQVLNFLGAKINYGGRVTDDKDQRPSEPRVRVSRRPDGKDGPDGRQASTGIQPFSELLLGWIFRL